MGENWSTIDILQNVRHDWLNRIQLIKGNISLGKQERAELIMDQIVQEMQQESRLTNLKLPEFAVMMLTHNWEGNKFRLEYEILDEHGSLPLDDKQLTNWMRLFFTELNRAFHPIHDNYLLLTIETKLDEIRFLFHLDGIIKDIGALKEWLSITNGYPHKVSLHKINDTEANIVAIFK